MAIAAGTKGYDFGIKCHRISRVTTNRSDPLLKFLCRDEVDGLRSDCDCAACLVVHHLTS